MKPKSDLAELRRKAERKLKKNPKDPAKWSFQDMETLVHDLETHQVELEMQNEELRRARHELEESQRSYADLYDFAPIGYFVLDRNGVIRSANFVGAQMIGRDKHGIMELPFSFFVVKEDQGLLFAHLQNVFERETKQTDELRLTGANGSILHVQLQSTIVEERERDPLTCRTAVIDITKRKQAEEALREGEERLRFALETSHIGAWDLDLADHTAYRSLEHDRIFGYQDLLPQWTYEMFLDRVVAEDRAAVDAKFREATNAHRDWNFECRIRRADGEVRWIWAAGRHTEDGTGNSRRMTGIVQDITDRKRMEEDLRNSRDDLEIRVQERTAELEEATANLKREMKDRKLAEEKLLQAQKLEAIGTLAGGIAHDFNNFLAAMIMNLELAIMDSPEGITRSNLELALKAGMRARDLIKQIVMFSRKSSGEEKLLSVGKLLQETYNMLRSSIPTTIQMELKLGAPSPDLILANPSEIQQIVVNLCTNAVHAMRIKPGKIEIKLKQETVSPSYFLPQAGMEPGEYLVLEVKDTGEGMTEEVKKRIFEPFFTTKPPGEGSGLGLSVVYGIVKKYRGDILVHSKRGVGSVFKIYLPKAQQTAQVQLKPDEPIPGGTERILLVDDEEMIALSIAKMLKHLGYQVTSFTSSLQALRFFSEKPGDFDMVITDRTMPAMPGETLASELIRVRADIPILLCTGYSELVSEAKCKEIGVQGIILKPFTIREGALLIRRLLDRKAGRKL